MTAVADRTELEMPPSLEMTVIETQRLDILACIIEARRTVGFVGKDGYNDHDKYHFRGIDDVVDAAKQVLDKLGVVIIPRTDAANTRDIVSMAGKAMREVTVMVTYRMYGQCGKDDYLDVIVPGESMDRGDKSTPKAMSVALRTCLIQVLLLQTKKEHPDPDSESFERGDADAVQQAAKTRESARTSPTQLVQDILDKGEELRQLLGLDDDAWRAQVAAGCLERYETDVVAKRQGDKVKALDLTKLTEARLLLLRRSIEKRISQERGI